MAKNKYILLFCVVLLIFWGYDLHSYKLIKILDNISSYRIKVAYGSEGKIYVVWDDTNNIYLGLYSNEKFSVIKSVSNNNYYSYEPDIGVDNGDNVYICWSDKENDSKHVVKCRIFYNSTWSDILEIASISHNIYDLRITVDSITKNYYITFMDELYGIQYFTGVVDNKVLPLERVYNEPGRRTKHGDIVVGKYYVHLVWQEKYGENYKIYYRKRDKGYYGEWKVPVNVDPYTPDYINLQKPRIDLDNFFTPHIIYMAKEDINKKVNYVIIENGKPTEPLTISNLEKLELYHYPDICVFSSEYVVFTVQRGIDTRGNGIFANEKVNYNWKDFYLLNGTNVLLPTYQDVECNNKEEFVVAFLSENKKAYLFFSTEDSEDNQAPIPVIIATPTMGLYPLSVQFNASKSYDPDGNIVKFEWDFGDGEKGNGKETYHIFNEVGKYTVKLTVEDDKGKTASDTIVISVYNIQPPLNQKFVLLENKSLFSLEYFYKISWEKNIFNQELGAKIVGYKVYRKGENEKEFTLIKKVDKDIFYVYDRSLGNKKIYYNYYVTSIDENGRESRIEDSYYRPKNKQEKTKKEGDFK